MCVLSRICMDVTESSSHVFMWLRSAAVIEYVAANCDSSHTSRGCANQQSKCIAKGIKCAGL
jgi:hypothetical protein